MGKSVIEFRIIIIYYFNLDKENVSTVFLSSSLF